MDELQNFKVYLEKDGKSKNTISSYIRAVENFKNGYESTFGMELAVLHEENVIDYLQLLRQARNQKGNLISPKTVNQHMNRLRSFNKYLIEVGKMSEEIVRRKLFQKVQQQIASPAKFDIQEVDRFFQLILESKNEVGERDSYRNYTIGKLLALSGCRISMALSILIEDIHLDTREIYIRSGKGNKGRTILINQRLQRILSKYLREIRPKYLLCAVSPYLFLSNRSRQLSRGTVNKSFKKYSVLAGLEQVLQPHDLRHYFCSECIKHGLGIHEVVNLAGHASIQTTSLYTNTDRRTMLNKLENL